MWIVIIATLAVAFASGLSMGSFLERGHWEVAFKEQLNKLDARRARRARRVRERRDSRLRLAAASGFSRVGRPVELATSPCKAANTA